MSRDLKITIIILVVILASIFISFIEYPCWTETHGFEGAQKTTCRIIDKLPFYFCDLTSKLTTSEKTEQLTATSEYVIKLEKCLKNKYWSLIF